MMKRLFYLLIALTLVFALGACGNSSSGADSHDTTNTTLSTSDIEDLAVATLYYQILDKCESSWSSDINPDETRYEIGRIEEIASGYRVRGKFHLYNDYGQITTPYSDGSGSYEQTFEVIIDKYGNIEHFKFN